MRTISALIILLWAGVLSAEETRVQVYAPNGVPLEWQQAVQVHFLQRPDLHVQFITTRPPNTKGNLSILFAQRIHEDTSNSVTILLPDNRLLAVRSLKQVNLKELISIIKTAEHAQSDRLIAVSVLPLVLESETQQLTYQISDALNRMLSTSPEVSVVISDEDQLLPVPSADRYVTVSVTPRKHHYERKLVVHVQVLDQNRKLIRHFKLTTPQLDGRFLAGLNKELSITIPDLKQVKPSRALALCKLPIHLKGFTDSRLSPTPIYSLNELKPTLDASQLKMLQEENWQLVFQQFEKWTQSLKEIKEDRRHLSRLGMSEDYYSNEVRNLSLKYVLLRRLAAQRIPADPELLSQFETRSLLLGHISFPYNAWTSDPELNRLAYDLFGQEYAKGSKQLFLKWRKAAINDPKNFDEFSRNTAGLTYELTFYNTNYHKQDQHKKFAPLAIDMGLMWLKEYEKIPLIKRSWRDAHQALGYLTAISANHTSFHELVEKLWVRLEVSPDPYLNLLGKQARYLVDIDHQKGPSQKQLAGLKQFLREAAALHQQLKKTRQPSKPTVVEETVVRLIRSMDFHYSKNNDKTYLEIAEELQGSSVFSIEALRLLLHPWDEESAKRSLNLLEQKRSVAREPFSLKLVSEWRKRWPSLKLEEESLSEINARSLLDIGKFGGGTQLHDLHIIGDHAIGLCSRGTSNQRSTSFIMIHLSNGQFAFRDHFKSYTTAVLVHDNRLFAAAEGQIMAMDLNSGKVTFRAELEKSLTPTAITVIDKKLYIGASQGRLFQMDMASQQLTLLIGRDAKRQLPKSFLSLRIVEILHDQPRNRLLLVTHDRSPLHVDSNSVWSYDLKSKELKRMFEYGKTQAYDVIAWLKDDKLYLINCWILTYDLEKGTHHLLANYPCGSFEPTKKIWLGVLTRPLLRNGTWWWVSDGLLRSVNVDGSNYTTFPTPGRQRLLVTTIQKLRSELIPWQNGKSLYNSRQQLYKIDLPADLSKLKGADQPKPRRGNSPPEFLGTERKVIIKNGKIEMLDK